MPRYVKGRVGALLDTPFARSPEGGGRAARYWPEICGLLVWGIFALTFALVDDSSTLIPFPGGAAAQAGELARGTIALSKASAVAYAVSGLLMIFLPIRAGAAAWATERDRGAMEAMVLVPCDHGRIAMGRLCWCAWGCFRFVLYTLPVYALLAHGILLQLLGAVNSWEQYAYMIHMPRWGYAIGQYVVSLRPFMPPEVTPLVLRVLVVAGRLLDDLSVLVLALGTGFYISTRLKTSRRALMLSQIIVLGALMTVLAPGIWLAVLVGVVIGGGGAAELAYTAGAPTGMVLRYALGIWLAVLAVRRFDRYVLGGEAHW
ncbi:MAG: hypothetical protein ACYTGB_18910 [Planctomycetota bacterium]